MSQTLSSLVDEPTCSRPHRKGKKDEDAEMIALICYFPMDVFRPLRLLSILLVKLQDWFWAQVYRHEPEYSKTNGIGVPMGP